VQGLTVRLPGGADRTNAVENVSFAVGPGENRVCRRRIPGSGKSVTAHAIMGLLPPRQLTVAGGRVLLEGDDILAKSRAAMRKDPRRPVGMIFQEPMTALNPVMKVGDQNRRVLDIPPSSMSANAARRARRDGLGAPARAGAHDRRLSASVVGRTAPAHHDRGRPRARSGAADRRRADHRARRHHAGQILKLIKDCDERRNTASCSITQNFGVVAEVAHRVVS